MRKQIIKRIFKQLMQLGTKKLLREFTLCKLMQSSGSVISSIEMTVALGLVASALKRLGERNCGPGPPWITERAMATPA